MSHPLARSLRQHYTPAEHRLWQHLRGRRLAGVKFRRQVAIEPYVVDFLSYSAKLIVELDGGQHALHAWADAARTRRLEQAGYRVVRFWNTEVMENIEAVLEAITQALEEATPASPTTRKHRGVAPSPSHR